MVQQIGGKEGYFYGNPLWKIRAWMDDIAGGGVVYGRPERETLAVGDLIDGWKVITIKPLRQLAMMFGMKAPGLGRLTFTIKDQAAAEALMCGHGGIRPVLAAYCTGLS